ncbi:MAG: polysaccharide biosynthesis tyrosine autokinase [Candidatus Schekmanbacteria bacterium]|nr:MAG: polysaccharide biosynthesis tyrosine autokinase [Candidatus Schekmanbacteria bacterium]
MAQYELDLRDYWRIIRKRRFIIISVTLLVGFLTFLFSLIQRPTPLYKATASVKVERATSLTGLLTEVVSWSTWDDIATQSVVITSYRIMEKVAQRLGFVPKNLKTEEIRKNPKYVEIISELQDSVEAEQEEDTNIINIYAESENPEDATLLANTVAEVYKEENRKERNAQVTEARKFIESQLKIVGKQLRESEEKLKNLQQRNGIMSEDSLYYDSLLKEKSSLRDEYRKVAEELVEAEKQLAILEKGQTIDEDFGRIYTPDYYSHLYELNRELLDLLLKRKDLREQYNDDYPPLKELEEKIRSIVNEMEQQIKKKVEVLNYKKEDILSRIKEVDKAIYEKPEDLLSIARARNEVEVNRELFSQLKTKYQEALIKEAEKVDEVTIVKPAFEEPIITNPSSISQKTAVGLFIGLLLGFVMALIIETLDTSIGTIEDLEQYLDIPVTGVIPDVGNEELISEIQQSGAVQENLDAETIDLYSKLISHFAPSSILSESYRAMRTNIQFMLLEKKYKTITITSASLGEGKTSVAINLGITLAQLGKKVLLIEGDLRKPRLHKVFGLEKEPGLTDIIIGNSHWKNSVRTVIDMMLGNLQFEQLFQTPGLDNLSIITCGHIPPNPSEFLNAQGIEELIEEIKEYFDLIIIDVPPVLPVTDAVILGAKTDAVLLVYRAGKIARSGLKRAKNILSNVKANVIGIVLLGLKPDVNPEYFKFGYKSYTEDSNKPPESRFIDTISRFFSKLESFFTKENLRKFISSLDSKQLTKIIISAIIVLLIVIGILWQTGGCKSEKKFQNRYSLKNTTTENIKMNIE